MDGTFNSTAGLPRTIRGRPGAKFRLAGLGLTVLIGALLMTWITRATWLRVNTLEKQVAGLKAENFYMGVRIRGEVQRLNETLLRYKLHGDTNDFELFARVSLELSVWIYENRTNVNTQLERAFLRQIGIAYDEYLIESRNVLEATRRWYQIFKVGTFTASYEKVQKQSQQLLDLCDGFINDQRMAFGDFLGETHLTLTAFQQLLKISLGLLLSLAVVLVFLVYRVMIAPLRHQLTESQAIIARQEKLASLGELAAGVAHEIRNPLTAIKVRLFTLKKALRSTFPDNEDVAVISDEINRLERIVKDFLQFARPSEPELVAIPAHRLLQEVFDLLKPQLDKAGIELKLEIGEPIWVKADTQQIKQVLINLIQNSADSIACNGVITLRAVAESAFTRKKGIAAAVLEVVDNGSGIQPEVQKRLFDPFFTTKEGGTGLGLPIAARIIEKHGGELQYQTEPDHGTTFKIILTRIHEHEIKNSAH